MAHSFILHPSAFIFKLRPLEHLGRSGSSKSIRKLYLTIYEARAGVHPGFFHRRGNRSVLSAALPTADNRCRQYREEDETMAGQDELTLRVHSGIPVVVLGGEWDVTLKEAVTGLLASLQKAGHFDIVLNVQRLALGGIAGVRSLASQAQAFRSHHGHLDIVGTVDQIEELLRGGVENLFRFSPSEEAALSRIKRTPVFGGGPCFTARPLE